MARLANRDRARRRFPVRDRLRLSAGASSGGRRLGRRFPARDDRRVHRMARRAVHAVFRRVAWLARRACGRPVRHATGRTRTSSRGARVRTGAADGGRKRRGRPQRRRRACRCRGCRSVGGASGRGHRAERVAADDCGAVRAVFVDRGRRLCRLSAGPYNLVFFPLMGAGIFITLEGVEGSGKTTQAALLADELRRRGRRVTLTREPGGTRAGEAIRAIFLDPTISLGIAAELLLVLADRAQHVREKLRPALAAGEIVISDRYSDSTIAYQGYGRGFDLELLAELNHLASNGAQPDLTIVLDCPAEMGLARARTRVRGDARGYDRFEGEDIDFHRRVRQGFLAIAHSEPERVKLIDSSRELSVVTTEILLAVESLVGH